MKFKLDIGAGKYNTELMTPDPNDSWCVVHIDRCYEGTFGKTITEVAEHVLDYLKITENPNDSYPCNEKGKIYHIFCKCDVFEFMDNFPIKAFDAINCNRMFEHLEYCGGEVGRMLEACNAISKYDATLEFVVPNAEILADMVLNKEELTPNDIMVLNTEFCNGKFDPHASIWTPRLAKYYIDQEDTWKITSIVKRYPFAGRDIYMKVFCKKPQEKQHNKELDKWA